MRIAFVGSDIGGVRMRGHAPAARLGWEVFEPGGLPADARFDVLILVKYDEGRAEQIRRQCDRLVFDPLDCWIGTTPEADPVSFWKATCERLRCDDVLATSPSAAACIEQGVGGSARVHLAPHHADPAIGPDWHDPSGPIVYAGSRRYVARYLREIEDACRRVGRPFLGAWRHPDSIRALRGASVSLSLWLPPWDTPLTRTCKPQVKLENAAAAGLPVVASDYPCVTSTRPQVTTVADAPGVGRFPWRRTRSDWSRVLAEAISAGSGAARALADAVTLDDHCRRLEELVGCA